MSWQREFPVRDTRRSATLVATCGLAVGLAVAQRWLWPGMLLALLAPVGGLTWRTLGTELSVRCGPSGLLVITRRGRNRRDAAIAWHDVTATAYSEGRPGDAGTGRFQLHTAAGVAFSAGPGTGQLQDLIEVCNAMTPHLPYVWQQQGRRRSGAPAFRSIPRPPS